MDVVDPQIPLNLLPSGSRAQLINSSKREYKDLPTVTTPKGLVISRWSPSLEERAAIVRGEDVFITMIAPNHMIHPFYITIGMVDWSNDHTS